MVEGFSEDVSRTVGAAFVTVWLVVPVAGLLFKSPAYVDVIGSLPTGRDVVVTIAIPVVALIGPETRVMPPLVTVTVPVVPMGRVVVMVTVAPKLLGFGADTTVRTGAVLLTVCVRFAVAVLLFVSPL